MDFDRYTLAVTSPEDWNSIHNALIVDSNEDGIPDRKVTCADSKEHSPTRGTYELTEEEANEIAKHPKVKWIELSPIHHPHSYPEPRPTTKRFKKNVKVYRNLGSAFSYGSTSAEENRTNWAVKRVGFHTNGDCWPGITGEPSPISSDVSYSLTGKNVDVVIQDSGVLQYHPEFLDDDGKSRVLDIVLDGPYHIDPSYFTSNSHTYTKPDGRVGITTASAHAWWENSSNRSGAFSSIGTVAIPSNYTVANAIGIGGTSHTMTSSHGTGCAGNAAGKNFGLAFESNIWNMSMVSTPTSMGSEASYDLIKIFHQNKPINTATGRKNPTIVNGSWGYYGAFNRTTNVSYKWKGSTGTFTGFTGSSTGVQAYAQGLMGSAVYDATFSTSSRSHSIDVAGAEMVEAGVIFVVAAGNDNQRLGVGSNDVQKNDYFTSLISGNDHRGTSLFPSGTLPMGSRDYLHPQGVGFSTVTDSHPVICVGAMDNYINESYEGFEWMTGMEQSASYSNNGPGIDVWAPADEVLSAGARASNGDQLGSETNYARYNSDFVDRYFNGTSSAAPVVTGLIALFLESNPSATSDDVKNFIKNDASVGVSTYLYYEGYPDINDDYYWMATSNMRGAERRILYNPYANDIIPTFAGVIGGESIITSGLVLNLDGNNYTSGTTWTDTSGQGNNGTLVGGTGYSSDNGGYLIFDGTDDKVTMSAGSDFAYGTGDFTVEIWFNVTGTSPQTWGEVLYAQTISGTNYFKVNASRGNPVSKYPTFTHATSGSGNARISSTAYTEGTWHHYLATRNGTTLTAYLDNSSVVTATVNQDFNNTTYVPTIGGYTHTNSNNFDGKIAQVRVYKGKGFSASDVQHNFDAMKGRYLDNPLILSGISYSLT